MSVRSVDGRKRSSSKADCTPKVIIWRRSALLIGRAARGPPISHWPLGSSAYQTQLPRAPTAIARTVVTKTKSGIFVLAAAVVWSSSRLSNPAASRDCGPFQQSALTAHDQHAPVAIPHCPVSSRPISHRRGLPSADRQCQRRLRSPKRRSLTTRPPFQSCTRRPKPTPR